VYKGRTEEVDSVKAAEWRILRLVAFPRFSEISQSTSWIVIASRLTVACRARSKKKAAHRIATKTGSANGLCFLEIAPKNVI